MGESMHNLQAQRSYVRSTGVGNDVAAQTFSQRVKVVGLNSQTSQGRGIDVTTSPDFPALETTPVRNVNGMPVSTLLSLLLLNSQITSLTLPRKRH